MDLLVSNKANEWIKTNHKVALILSKINPNQEDLKSFKILFIDKFLGRFTDLPVLFFNVEVFLLKQAFDKSLLTYYK